MIIGTGIDVVDIARFRSVIDKLKDRFILKVFAPGERDFCLGHRDPVPHFAARFAAKEALFKALGTGWTQGVTWLDAEVHRERAGAPVLLLHGEAERLSRNKGATRVHLSLSHTAQWAVATVILES